MTEGRAICCRLLLINGIVLISLGLSHEGLRYWVPMMFGCGFVSWWHLLAVEERKPDGR